ncbi:MAG TPA: anthranilate phosphoribosyltransferase, partial [Gelria sp.]|nr:anthranilate phosphoribosyltransferase [Gelria sp.]
AYQVMGIADTSLQEAIGQTLLQLGRKRALVVCAENGMDEISPIGITRVFDAGLEQQQTYTINPATLGMAPVGLEAIRGGDKGSNVKIIRDIFVGVPGPYRQVVVLNAAAALMTAGRARDMQEGMLVAAEAIDSGKSRATLQAMISYSRDRVMPC